MNQMFALQEQKKKKKSDNSMLNKSKDELQGSLILLFFSYKNFHMQKVSDEIKQVIRENTGILN